MPATAETLGLDQMTVADRLALIEVIWDSLPQEVEAQDVPAWHWAELEKRLAAAEAQPSVGRPWRDVLDGLGKPK